MERSPNRSSSGLEAFLARHNRLILWSLFATALLRIFFFNAVFPFFNNVDEQAHFDTVVKYSKGFLPGRGSINFERESAQLIVQYGSPEYLNTAENFESGNIPPPFWCTNPVRDSSSLNQLTDSLTKWMNHEATSPPVYYAIAGMWYNFGKLIGLKDGFLLYWIRFLNIPIYALLFWVIHQFLKNASSVDLSAHFGVLLLLTFFPQDAFYSITNDGLSALLGATSFYLLTQACRTDRLARFYLLTGLMLAATFLTKLSNFPILILAILLTVYKAWTLRAENLKPQWRLYICMAAGCMLPIAVWLGWNASVLGDLTGSSEKIQSLGWTSKALSKIHEHPFFHLQGIGYFISELFKTFWRGEFVWGLQRIASQPVDLFYVVSSVIFVSCSVINAMLTRKTRQQFVIRTAATTLFLWVVFIAALSTLYDFGNCWYPSRTLPFFTSGRLILGALLPFLVLYIDGLRVFISRISKNRINLIPAVLLICILITYSEFQMTFPVIESQYNWIHLF